MVSMKKRIVSFVMAMLLIISLIPINVYAAQDGTVTIEYITGEWSGKRHGSDIFCPDPILWGCTYFEFSFEIVEYTGNPFRTWLLSVRDDKDQWTTLGSFVMNKDEDVQYFSVPLDKPINISGFQVELDGGAHEVTFSAMFYDAVVSDSYSSSPSKSTKPSSGSDDYSWTVITGAWNGTHNNYSVFELDPVLKNCSQFDLYCKPVEYSGNPFRTWLVYCRNKRGEWTKVDSFVLSKDYADEGQYFTIKLKNPMDVSAIQIQLDGGYHTITYQMECANAK